MSKKITKIIEHEFDEKQQELYDTYVTKGHNTLVAKHMAMNNITDDEKFIDSTFDYETDYEIMKDAVFTAKAIERQVKEDPENIVMVGDYDTDGITSSSIFHLFLKDKYGIEPTTIIPERQDGYGLSKGIIDKINDMGKSFIVTADNGISAHEAIDYAKSLGMKVYITDHHPVKEGIGVPDADAVVNPAQNDCPYYDYLAGVGVIFNVLRCIDNDIAMKYLPFVAIGTIADLVPLKEENRIFAKQGLMADTSFIPSLEFFKEKINVIKPSPSDVGFKMAPLLNSAGRQNFAYKSFQFLVEEDGDKIASLYKELEDLNVVRKEKQVEMEKIAMDRVDDSKKSILVIADNEFEFMDSVCGLVAGKVAEKYQKPAIVMAMKEDGSFKGSGRSVDWFNFRTLINRAEPEGLMKGGGHSAAAGFTIKAKDIEAFSKVFEDIAQQSYIAPGAVEVAMYMELEDARNGKTKTASTTEKVNEYIRAVETISPCGMGNEEPVIAVRSDKFTEYKVNPKKNYLSFRTPFGIKAGKFGDYSDGDPKLSETITGYFTIEHWEKSPGKVISFPKFNMKTTGTYIAPSLKDMEYKKPEKDSERKSKVEMKKGKHSVPSFLTEVK